MFIENALLCLYDIYPHPIPHCLLKHFMAYMWAALGFIAAHRPSPIAAKEGPTLWLP